MMLPPRGDVPDDSSKGTEFAYFTFLLAAVRCCGRCVKLTQALSKGQDHELGPGPGKLEATQRESPTEVGKLTDDDVDVINGQRNELIGKIQERYGTARDAAEDEVKSFCDACK